MRGVPTLFAAVKQLYLLAWDCEIVLEFVWVPRFHEELQYADFLSKRPDPADRCFLRHFAQQLVFDRLHRSPDIDCLASHAVHMCTAYFSAIRRPVRVSERLPPALGPLALHSYTFHS